MKITTIRFAAVLVAIPGVGTLIGCGPAHFIGNAEIPTATKLSDVMWSQAQLADPAFKKISASAYHDTDWATFTALGERLQLSSGKLKQDFSMGAAWNALADALGAHGDQLIDAAKAKDQTAASTALATTRATCRACHEEYK